MQVTLDVPTNIAAIYERDPETPVNELSSRYGISNYEARAWWFALRNGKISHLDETYQDRVKKYFTERDGTLEVNSLTICTLEEALAVADVDLEKYEVERHIVNSWGVTAKIDDELEYRTNYQVKVWLKTKKRNPFADALEKIAQSTKPIKPLHLKTSHLSKNIAGEIAPFDLHFGKFAWHPETMSGNMDLGIAKKVFVDSCLDNLEKIAKWNPSKIFFILGNDMMHFENIWATTPMGKHSLDSDGRLQKVAEECQLALMEIIDACAQVSPVEVKRIAGNHDLHASFWLAQVLKQRYRDNPHIVVDNSPADKKAELWGRLLVAWTHDASGRKQMPVVNELPQFWPELWGRSRWREWHVGHKHKAEVTRTKPVATVGSVLIRQLSALSTVDKWHVDGAFTDAVPCCESFIWDKEAGIRASYPSFIDYLKED